MLRANGKPLNQSTTGAVNEPYAGALHQVDVFMDFLLRGYSMAEAALFANTQAFWQQDTWGDPLYRPFARQGLPHGQTANIADATPRRAAQCHAARRDISQTAHGHIVTDTTPPRTATWQN